MSPRLLITPGDAAGIGPEIALKAAPLRNIESTVIYVGPEWLWEQTAETFACPMPERIMPVPALQNMSPQRPKYGAVDAQWGRVAMECVRTAAQSCLAGDADAIVTAPFTKAGIHLAGYEYKGHTDFLADITDTHRHAMMLSTGNLRVVLVTHHESLHSVLHTLTGEMIEEKIELAHETGLQLCISAPRIAVCGINPHAGENGAFGSEEEEIIIPACQRTREKGIHVEGPFPSDSIFGRVVSGAFDFVIAMYHDQGLIPVKLHGFDNGVNTTLGLPIIRTSPGHGSAYDIAGQMCANPKAMRAAMDFAAQLAHGKDT